jgi:phosphate transport system substrate-binding protein
MAGATAGAMAFTAVQAADISGAGATFPYPIYAKWAGTYAKDTGMRMNYQSIGSGGGIKQIKAGTVDFGASDMPLKPEELEGAGLAQFPMIMGGVVPVVNIEGVAPGALKLDGTTLADIYAGKIKKWDDEAIKKLNPGLALPDSRITAVHRSDGSGTSFLFTTYLSQANADWKAKVGANTAVDWPKGGISIGGTGNEGVASYVKQVKGSIGYVEYAYAIQNKLTHVSLQNHDGQFVQPSIEAFEAAAAGADWANARDFYLVLTDQPGAQSWPIVGASFILLHRQPKNPARTVDLLKFFDWAYANGGQAAEQLAYVPIPDSVVALVRKMWSENIKGSDGGALYAAQAAQ